MSAISSSCVATANEQLFSGKKNRKLRGLVALNGCRPGIDILLVDPFQSVALYKCIS